MVSACLNNRFVMYLELTLCFRCKPQLRTVNTGFAKNPFGGFNYRRFKCRQPSVGKIGCECELPRRGKQSAIYITCCIVGSATLSFMFKREQPQSLFNVHHLCVWVHVVVNKYVNLLTFYCSIPSDPKDGARICRWHRPRRGGE